MTNTPRKDRMIKPRFWLARRDTRWDVYPQREPLEAIAHDHYGFWAQYEPGKWFKTPRSYVFQVEITEELAEEFARRGGGDELAEEFSLRMIR